MRVPPDERELLESLYTQWRIPTDQFKRRRADLQRLTAQWNGLTDRNDEPGEVLHYMITQRKQKKWPRLGNNHQKIESIPADLLTEEEWQVLRDVYTELHEGSDNYAYSPQLRSELEQRFAGRAGRIASGLLLCAAIEAKRKRGLWVTIGDDDEPFSDMDAVVA